MIEVRTFDGDFEEVHKLIKASKITTDVAFQLNPVWCRDGNLFS